MNPLLDNCIKNFILFCSLICFSKNADVKALKEKAFGIEDKTHPTSIQNEFLLDRKLLETTKKFHKKKSKNIHHLVNINKQKQKSYTENISLKPKSLKEREASLSSFFQMPVILGSERRTQGSPSENGGITTNEGLKIALPPMPKPNKSPIIIKMPTSAWPQVVADAKKQKPIVIVPEILYPHKRKRILIHHAMPFQTYYQQMFGSLNPYYMQMAMNNKYYKDVVSRSPVFQTLVNSPNFSDGMKIAKEKLGGGQSQSKKKTPSLVTPKFVI